MTILHTIILGIIEGLTEFLPVSSTGHLVIGSQILGIVQTEFVKSFEIIIQVGAIAAVSILYVKKVFGDKTLWKKILAGFIPTAVIGFLLYKVVKTFLIGNIVVVAWSLIIGGVILIGFEWWYKKSHRQGKSLEDINYWEAFIIGCVQSLAVIPGVSRSGATIVGGLVQNISRPAIVEFSFLLAVPVLVAAAGLDILKTSLHFSGNEWGMLILGSAVSFVVALFAIKFFLNFVKTKTFEWFGWYRIVVGVVVLVWVFLR